MRIVILVTGVIIILAAFWFLSIKRLTVDFAAAWGILGIAVLFSGIVRPLYVWILRIFSGTGTAVPAFAAVCLLVCFLFSLSLSRLAMQNQELALEVSLLRQENEKTLCELERILTESGKHS